MTLITKAISDARSRAARPLMRPRVRSFLDLARPVAAETELIRLGGEGDGGYLVPDDLDGVSACFSPGVADRAGFETDLAARGVRSFMIDASVEAAPLEHPLMDFEKLFLGPATGGDVVSLDDWVARRAPADAGDLMLQMDIEGAEYDVLAAVSRDTLRRFRIVIVEFHRLQDLISRSRHGRIRRAFEALLQDFRIVHLHPNNCCGTARLGDMEIPRVLEATFHRKDRVRPSGRRLAFPNPLDRPNLADRPDLVLPACWR